MIYIILFFYTIICAFLFSKRRISTSSKLTRTKVKNFFAFFTMILPCIVVAGIRYGISVDYIKVYERGFYYIKSGMSEFESGFTLLVRLCSMLIDEPWFMFFVVSFITVLVYFIAFRSSRNYLTSVILFFGAGVYFDSFNGIRQYIVCAIFLYCIRYIKMNDWKKYFFIMGLCSFIHTSALFTLPLYFLKKIKINKMWCIGISTLLFVFQNRIFNLVMMLISVIPKYNEYILRNTISAQISLSMSGIIMAIIALIPCILAEREMFETEEGTFYYNMMMIGLFVAISTAFLPFAERLLYYSRTCILLAVPFSCELLRGKKSKIVNWITVGSMSCMNFLGIFLMGWYAVLPYVTIFNK